MIRHFWSNYLIPLLLMTCNIAYQFTLHQFQGFCTRFVQFVYKYMAIQQIGYLFLWFFTYLLLLSIRDKRKTVMKKKQRKMSFKCNNLNVTRSQIDRFHSTLTIKLLEQQKQMKWNYCVKWTRETNFELRTNSISLSLCSVERM